MTTTLWRAAAGAFTVATILAAFLVAWSLLRVPGDVQVATEQQAFDRTLERIVFSDFESSDISVSARDRAGVLITRRYRWTGDDMPRYTETWSAGTLTISHECGNARDSECSIGYEVAVPAGVIVEAETSSGDVAIRGRAGHIELATVSGDVTLRGSPAAVRIRTVSGDVSASDLRSSQVDASATSGNLILAFSVVPQALAVQTTTGDTTIRVPPASGPFRLSLQSTDGDHHVTVERSEQSSRSITVESTSGDVTIGYA